MNRKQFLKKAALGLGTAAGLPAILSISESVNEPKQSTIGTDCEPSPKEMVGPFPNHDSNALLKRNIALDRQGVAMTMTLTVLSQKNGCKPLPGVFVDVWHCDAHGAYSEYGGMRMQEADHRHEHFCRGRQITDKDGKAVVLTTTLEHAELKRDQIHAYGKDHLEGSKGSMWSTIEPTE